MKLFKYTTWRPFDAEGNSHKCNTRENLLRSLLYFNSAEKFNDPFDLCPFFDIDCSDDELKRTTTETIMQEEGLTQLKARRKALQLIRQQGLHTMSGRKSAVEKITAKMMNVGVCCFTTNQPTTILMWSHYGDHHMGLCLEFDIPNEMPSSENLECSFLPPVPVTYSNHLPKFKLVRHTLDDLLCCLRTKSMEWKYENEYRAMHRNYIGTIAYSPSLLQSVTAGCKMQDKEFDELSKTIRNMKIHPNLFRAQKKEREFGLTLIKC